jgi:hypothetical protein
MTIPHITIEQIKALYQGYDERSYQHFLAADNSLIDAYNEKQAQQESEYITAAQARELGAGKSEIEIVPGGWIVCGAACGYIDKYLGIDIKYRAIKQAQPEPVCQWQENDNSRGFDKLAEKQSPELLIPVDPHAELRAEYAKQVEEGTTGFYLWGFQSHGFPKQTCTPDAPEFRARATYTCTDISCYVSKDGEPAVRMLRTDAQELQRELGDVVEWFFPNGNSASKWEIGFDAKGTYTYRTKATIKLNGNRVTPAQAAAEWEAKKETHDVWIKNDPSGSWFKTQMQPRLTIPYSQNNNEYELRPKQPTWTGSREDVIALIKEMGLL